MSATTQLLERSLPTDVSDGLRRLATLPDWLAALQPDLVIGASAPITRQRIALWEALAFLRAALHAWTKVKPVGADNDMLILEHHLRGMGLW